jgi:hypothetical protein
MARKSLFNSTMFLNEDTVNLKNVVLKQSSTRRQPDSVDKSDSDYDPDDDASDAMSVNSEYVAKAAVNRTISKLKKEAPSTPKTPSAATTTTSAKKKTGIVRRNTISISSHTPTMQKRAFSKIDQSSLSAYEKARIKLHVANTPDCLPCRDKQFSDIFNFIETNLKNQTGG